MRQLEEISSENATPKNRKVPYESKRGLNNIQDAIMTEHEPISYPGRTEERKVRLLPLSTCSLWICIDDIPWIVRWLSDELRIVGVHLPTSDPLDAPKNAIATQKTFTLFGTPVAHGRQSSFKALREARC